jgi:hypothetical protein
VSSDADGHGAGVDNADNLRPVSVTSIASASRLDGRDTGVPIGEKPSPMVDGARSEISDALPAKAGCSGRPITRNSVRSLSILSIGDNETKPDKGLVLG